MPRLARCRGWPDTRQHQELRRVDGSAAQNDFALRPDGLARTLPDDLDAFCPTALDDDPRRDRLRQQVEIAALPSRLSEGHRGAGAATVGDVGVDPAKTLDDIGVEVIDDRVPRLAGSSQKRVADRQIEPRLLDRHRAVVAVPLAGAAAVASPLFLKYGSTWSNDHPWQPRCAHWSYSSEWPRRYSMPLMLPEPPRMRP